MNYIIATLTVCLLACIGYKLVAMVDRHNRESSRRYRLERRLNRMVKDDRIKATMRRVMPEVNILGITLVSECPLHIERGELAEIPDWANTVEVRVE